MSDFYNFKKIQCSNFASINNTTTMNTKKEKLNYTTPVIEVLEIMTEFGFAASFTEPGNNNMDW
jgi:ribosomal protein S8